MISASRGRPEAWLRSGPEPSIVKSDNIHYVKCMKGAPRRETDLPAPANDLAAKSRPQHQRVSLDTPGAEAGQEVHPDHVDAVDSVACNMHRQVAPLDRPDLQPLCLAAVLDGRAVGGVDQHAEAAIGNDSDFRGGGVAQRRHGGAAIDQKS